MVLVKPATVVQWHREGFRLYWRWRSRRAGRPKMSTEIRDLIRRMSLANPLWGAPQEARLRTGESSIEEANHRHRRLLRPCRQRPRRRRAAEEGEEVAALYGLVDHSITSSAIVSSSGGTVRPSRRAVSALMTSSNFDDCSRRTILRSAAPRSIRC